MSKFKSVVGQLLSAQTYDLQLRVVHGTELAMHCVQTLQYHLPVDHRQRTKRRVAIVCSLLRQPAGKA